MVARLQYDMQIEPEIIRNKRRMYYRQGAIGAAIHLILPNPLTLLSINLPLVGSGFTVGVLEISIAIISAISLFLIGMGFRGFSVQSENAYAEYSYLGYLAMALLSILEIPWPFRSSLIGYIAGAFVHCIVSVTLWMEKSKSSIQALYELTSFMNLLCSLFSIIAAIRLLEWMLYFRLSSIPSLWFENFIICSIITPLLLFFIFIRKMR